VESGPLTRAGAGVRVAAAPAKIRIRNLHKYFGGL
jgi:hypothetical protein